MVDYVGLAALFDFDRPFNVIWLVIARVIQACTLTWNLSHPDQLWQASQVAYNWVYGGVFLSWEWAPEYQLRNTIYPAFLAGPLYLLKEQGLDTQPVVLLQPYLTHSILVILGDLFLWKSAKKYVGSEGAKLAMLLHFFSKTQTENVLRTFTNSVEQILAVIAFYYFLRQKDRFTGSTVMLTATITLSFMMRTTSPIGWVPLLAIKVFSEGAFVPFLIAGIFVAVPIIAATVAIDTWYYLGIVNGTDWAVPCYNFFKVNVG